jgi:hypothetical protein
VVALKPPDVLSAVVSDETEGNIYPRHVLRGAETALCVFAGAFYGRQDAYWLAQAGLLTTCVDVEPMDAMRRIYPSDWEFVQADAFEFVEQTGRMWDIVSIDCPTGAFQRCADMIGEWCDLARKTVILGTGIDTVVDSPIGWHLTHMLRRSDFKGGVYWAVLERE